MVFVWGMNITSPGFSFFCENPPWLRRIFRSCRWPGSMTPMMSNPSFSDAFASWPWQVPVKWATVGTSSMKFPWCISSLRIIGELEEFWSSKPLFRDVYVRIFLRAVNSFLVLCHLQGEIPSEIHFQFASHFMSHCEAVWVCVCVSIHVFYQVHACCISDLRYACTHIYVYTYTYMYLYIYICMCIYIYIYIYMRRFLIIFLHVLIICECKLNLCWGALVLRSFWKGWLCHVFWKLGIAMAASWRRPMMKHWKFGTPS